LASNLSELPFASDGKAYYSPLTANDAFFVRYLANGAMGNARWVGMPLKAVLDKAGVAAAARQVTFDGVDTPVLPATPDFRKDARHRTCAESRANAGLGE